MLHCMKYAHYGVDITAGRCRPGFEYLGTPQQMIPENVTAKLVLLAAQPILVSEVPCPEERQKNWFSTAEVQRHV